MSKNDFYSQLIERTRTESLLAAALREEQAPNPPSLLERGSGALKARFTRPTKSQKHPVEPEPSLQRLSRYDRVSALLAKQIADWKSVRAQKAMIEETFPAGLVGEIAIPQTVSPGSLMRFNRLDKMSPFVLILTGALALGTTGFFILRDQMIMSLMQRQSELQLAYENRLVSMRAEIDKITSRQMVDQDSVEGRMQAILVRQAQLENRASMIAALSDQVASIKPNGNSNSDRSTSKVTADKTLTHNPLAQKSLQDYAPPAAMPDGVLGYAPNKTQQADEKSLPNPSGKNKPQPEGLELGKPSNDKAELGPRASLFLKPVHRMAMDPAQPLDQQLDRLSGAIEQIEQQQISTIAQARSYYSNQAAKLKVAFTEIGLSPDSLAGPRKNDRAMGGPFIPMKLNPKAEGFEGEIARLQAELLATSAMRQALPYVPLRKPLPVIDQTSTFGYRVDPFIGRMAMHTGIDLRLAYGAPVHATAAGKIDSASYNGGYGKMVDIDHGNGLVTRYGHLSSIAVKEGQFVKIGDVIGYLGSTGRSTGPHLHYEIRIHDSPVDPQRFLRAGAKLANEL